MTISMQGRMAGKSWAALHSLFQQWVVTSFPPAKMPSVETLMLMWAAWRASREIYIAGLRAENAMLREDNENLKAQLDTYEAEEYNRQQGD